jgi:hypothetical protein
MTDVAGTDVEAAMKSLRHAAIRAALLGVDSTTAAGWLGAPPGKAERGNLFFGVSLPIGDGSSVPAAAAIANALIGGREDAIVAERLRGATGLVYDFESRMIPVAGSGSTLWYLRVGTRTVDGAAVVTEVKAALARMPDDTVVVRRIDEFREWLAQQRQNQARDPRRWVNALLVNGKPLELTADDIRKTSSAEVVAVLRMLRDAQLTVTPAVVSH